MKPEQRIQVESGTDGARFILPCRDTSRMKTPGLIMGGISLLMLLFIFFWMYAPASSGLEMIRQGNRFGWALVAFSLFGMIGVFVAAKILDAAIAVLRGTTRSEIEIKGDRIYSREYFGWFHLKFKKPIARIDHLVIDSALKRASGVDERFGRRSRSKRVVTGIPFLNVKGLGAIIGGSSAEKKGAGGWQGILLLAPLYPLEMLDALAEKIAVELDKQKLELARIAGVSVEDFHLTAVRLTAANSLTPSKSPDSSDTTVTARTGPADSGGAGSLKPTRVVSGEEDSETPVEQPEDSSIVVSQTGPGSTVYRVPPRGLLQGSHGLFFFSLVWNGFMVIFTAAAGPGMFNDVPLAGIGFLVLFWGVGIGLLVAAVNMGRRSSMIGILKDQLVIERKSIFGTKWIERPAKDLLDVYIGHSGMEVNDEPVMDLKVEFHDGTTESMLSQLDEDELAWLVSRLRIDLNLQEAANDSPRWMAALYRPGWPDPPEGSAIVFDAKDGSRFRVKPKGWLKMLPTMLLGIFFIVAPLAFAWFRLQQNDIEMVLMIVGGIFVAVGTCLLLHVVIGATRSIQIECSSRYLQVFRRGLFGSREFQFARKNLEWIDMTETGTVINGVPVQCLTIQTVSDSETKPLRILKGRNRHEVCFVAATLNRCLKMGPGFDPIQMDTVGKRNDG